MSGLDCLREELLKRGCKKSQVESEVVAIVLDILSQSNTASEQWKQEKDFKSRENRITNRENSINLKIKTFEMRKAQIDSEFEKYKKTLTEMIDYVDKFNKSLFEINNQEMISALKAAQVFINTVNIETKYDNTAFIIGLSAILTNTPINPIGELKKLNPRAIVGLNDMLNNTRKLQDGDHLEDFCITNWIKNI